MSKSRSRQERGKLLDDLLTAASSGLVSFCLGFGQGYHLSKYHPSPYQKAGYVGITAANCLIPPVLMTKEGESHILPLISSVLGALTGSLLGMFFKVKTDMNKTYKKMISEKIKSISNSNFPTEVYILWPRSEDYEAIIYAFDKNEITKQGIDVDKMRIYTDEEVKTVNVELKSAATAKVKENLPLERIINALHKEKRMVLLVGGTAVIDEKLYAAQRIYRNTTIERVIGQEASKYFTQ